MHFLPFGKERGRPIESNITALIIQLAEWNRVSVVHHTSIERTDISRTVLPHDLDALHTARVQRRNSHTVTCPGVHASISVPQKRDLSTNEQGDGAGW